MALRKVILGADPSISDGVKWNAPSFCTTEYFATINLRAKAGVEVILHFGAKRNRISDTPETFFVPCRSTMMDGGLRASSRRYR
ncbi:MAG: hypothetical protein ABL904_04925 [Hyphomicrobiaceae bacterium]